MNWFERHLNWSLFLAWIPLPFTLNFIIALIALSFFGSYFPIMRENPEFVMENVLGVLFPLALISVVVNLALAIFFILVVWWYLAKKGRSKGFLILIIGPFIFTFIVTFFNSDFGRLLGGLGFVAGIIILFFLENQSVGYDADFVMELEADRWQDTGQLGMSDDRQYKELEYKYVEDASDVSPAGGEIPAKPPAEIQEKAVDKVPVEAPAAYSQEETTSEAPVEASEKLPVEATPAAAEIQDEAPAEAIEAAPVEALEESPAEAPVEAIEESSTEALEELPAEALEEAPEEIPAAAAQVTETISSQPMSNVPILLDDTGAVLKCFYHPEADAVNSCSRCGQYVCSQCNYVTGTHPICRNCWERRGEKPISAAVLAKKPQGRNLEQPGKKKAGEDERSREFLLLYEQALPFISAVVTKSPDGLPASPLDLMEGLKLRPMLKHAKKLSKPKEKELQEAKKTFEQLLEICVKVGETAADFVTAGGQKIPTEANFARLADGVEKASGLMGQLYQRMSSFSQTQG
ncbi:MAG: hypothetical protein JXB43_09355 [Dehalococcoidia bacterium]|nr:hypothetical protein [Dehalococcoidia bacterium]